MHSSTLPGSRTSPSRLTIHARALLLYALVAVLFNWPLPLDMSGSLTGPIGGDTGVYVWNIWLFRHEIVAHGHFPLFTHEILSLMPPVDLSLHNYTLFADALAFPFIPLFGVTATFNLVYLFLTVLTAWAMFLLARSVVRREAEAWLAGLLFGFSPVLVTRGTGHFSLAAAAPLPMFLWTLRRAGADGGWRYAVAAGATVAWASMCDAYYGIFCLLIGCCYFTIAFVQVRARPDGPPPAAWHTRAIDGLIVCVAAVIAIILVSGGTELHLGGQRIAMRSLYTPVLALTILAALRLWARRRPLVALRLPPMPAVRRPVLLAGAACLLLLSPTLFAFGYSVADGAALHGRIYWRSSPPGVDLLALFMPNPNQAWFGAPWRDWLTHQTNGYVENVASLTFVGIAVIAIAVWKYRFRPPRFVLALTVFFAALALGPFVHVGGVNTYVPGPWALLRYVPILSATRTPARYAIPLMMAFSLVFALALRRITARHPAHRGVLLCAVGLALAFELTPFPREMYSAHAPAVYQAIANDPRDVRVLELPFGLRDGEWSLGNFSAATQFHQTFHQHRLIGGYLSRISNREVRRQRGLVTVRGLLRMSQGERLTNGELDVLKQAAPAFIERARLGYVVVDQNETPRFLRQFAIDAYRLVKLDEADGYELYAPALAR